MLAAGLILLLAAGAARAQTAAPVPPLTAAQTKRALSLTFLFENEKIDCLYGYIQDLSDGRGFTSGCIGFNVRSGTTRDVVERYTRKAPGNGLAFYVPRLQALEAVPEIDSATLSAALPGFEAAWRTAAEDPLFRRAQDEAVSEGFDAAVREADRLGIRTPLGRAIVYDTLVQHGMEDGAPDPDSMPPMARKATAALGGGPETAGEKLWLERFLLERRKILADPHDPVTKGAWATSVDRVDVFLMLLRQDNLDLHGPIVASPYFDAVVP